MTTTTLMNTLGWTLIHFVWQGMLIGLLLAVALLAGRHYRGMQASRYRYGVALAALLLVVLAPLATFLWLWLETPQKIIQPANINLVLASLSDGPGVLQSMRDTWLSYLLIGWFAGVAWGSSRLLISWLSLYMVRHTGIQPTPLWLQEEFRRLRQECRIHRSINLLISNVVRVPLTAGWIQPVILLPASALTGLQPEQIRLILRHELAHIQRYDYLVNWLQNLVMVMLFYHPVVHWIIRVLNDERELCCDHAAIRDRCRPVDYAKILVKLQEASVPQPALAAIGKGGLYRRVERLLNSEAENIAAQHDTSRSFAWVFTVMLSVLLTSVGMLSSPSGHASYRDVPGIPIIHPLSDLPAIVELRTEQREQLIRYHQQTNFATFQWPSALAPVPKQSAEVSAAESSRTTQPSIPLSELHRQIMQQVKQQLPDDSVVPTAGVLVDQAPVADAGVAQNIEPVNVSTELPSLSELLAKDDNKYSIPEPYIKVKPDYPRRLSGLFEHEVVDIAYSINQHGQPVDLVVLSSHAHNDFSDAAIKALSQWRFDPVSPAIQKLRISQRFNFMQAQTSLETKCSTTGGRLCPKVGKLMHRIQVNRPNIADT